MRKPGRILEIALASALIALAAWCHASYGDETAPGPGAWIGVTVKPLSEVWRDQWEYRGSGVLVTGVTPTGPAAQAGITPGDLLVVVGSVSLWGEDDLALAKSRIDPSQSVPVVVARDNGHVIKIMNLEPVSEPEAIPVPAVPGNGDEPVAQPPSGAATSSLQPASGAEASSPEPASGAEASSPEPAPKSDAPGDRWAAFGTQCADLNPDLASALSVPVSRGVLVLQVTKGSFADRAGIRAGDVITAAGDESIDGVEGLTRTLEGATTALSVHVQRQNAERDVEVSLVSPPAPGAQDDSIQAPENQQEVRDELQALRREIERLRAQVEAKRGD